MYSHLISDSSGEIFFASEASNVLEYIKSLIDQEFQSNHEINTAKINIAAGLIQSVTEWRSDDERKILYLFGFIYEQLTLTLSGKGNYGFKYSNALITTCFLWHMTAASLYRRLREVFMLPTVRRLQQLCQDESVEKNFVDMTYISKRTTTLD